MSTTQTLTLTENEAVTNCKDEEDSEPPVREAELFTFDNCSKGIGIKICGGCSLDGEELYSIFVKRVLTGGLADQDGGLRKGDQILQVNGESLEGVTNERAVAILRWASASNHVEMVVVRDEQARVEFQDVLDKNSGCSVPCTPIPTDPQQSLTNEALKQRLIGADSEPSPTLKLRHPPDASSIQQQQDGEQCSPQEPDHTPVVLTPQDPTLNGGITPKLKWRGVIPSHTSTPLAKGSTTSMRTGSSGSQFSSLPYAEPSPVRAPIMSMTATTNMSDGSSVFTANSLSRLPKSRNMTQSQKLSLDPQVMLKVEKLNAALSYIGLEPTPEQEEEIQLRLNVAPSGKVTYGDFVQVAREVFQSELEGKSLEQNAGVFAANDLTDLFEPPAFRHDANGGASGTISHDQLLRENADLRRENLQLQILLREKENERLGIETETEGGTFRSHVQLAARDMEHDYKEVVHLLETDVAQLNMQLSKQGVLLREKEDELLGIRMEAQGAIHEQRTLRSKVHLAAEAQKAARDMEHDYEEVVHLLETEIAQLKMQLGKQGESDPIMQRRLAVLTCQLRKAEQEKETLKVATNKLLQFAENVYETLSEGGTGSSRPHTGSNEALKSGKHKRSKPNTKHVANDAKEVVRTVRSLIDTHALPFGWEETYTADGMKYYINHLNQVTTWSHPLSNVTHLPTIENEQKLQGADPKPSETTE